MTKPKDEPQTPGRKPRAGEAATNVSVRLVESEKKTYEAEAKRSGMTLGQWIRAACEAFLKKARK